MQENINTENIEAALNNIAGASQNLANAITNSKGNNVPWSLTDGLGRVAAALKQNQNKGVNHPDE